MEHHPSSSSLKLPVFDISKPLSDSSLTSLNEACREWGFFHVSNHGVSSHLFEKLRRLSGDVFGLSYETKMKVGPCSLLNTYTPHFIASPFFESLRVSGPDFFSSANSSIDVLFDQTLHSEFSEILKEYGEKMTELSEKIIKAILASFKNDLDKKYYESEFKNCNGYFRINNYTHPTTTEIFRQDHHHHRDEDEGEEEGLGMHTDMSCITIVNQDEVGGLQVRSNGGDWFDINPNADTLVVNVGDLLHAWSDGRLRSSQHRVVMNRRSFTNRFSVAFFWCFADEKVVYAPDDVAGVRVFRSFTCGDYLRFRESNEKGKFEKVGYTVKDFAGLDGGT
ncbi:PREDICTED: gibberellin 20 oxidase 2 [Tarenaya hassleriana]|uniref:gibberellin 20 oxidase 2 n=1 Tax=Tarenaya hassleriana TaxID=28532 RepID=UPI00053C16CB|nr:PREDICTED: gibberellin 20 oxidase 2 [Tarenaya hassleriana]